MAFNQEVETIENLLTEVTTDMEATLEDLRFMFDLLFTANNEFMLSLVEDSVEEVVKNPAFKHRGRDVRAERIADIAKQVFNDKIMPDLQQRVNERSAQDRKTKPTGSVLGKELKHYRIIKLWNHYRIKFERLYAKLSNAVGTSVGFNEMLELLTNLEKIGTIQEIQIQGSCTNFQGGCRNYIETFNLSYVKSTCQACGSDSLSWIAFAPLERRILHSWRMNLIPELVVGGILSQSPWVDQI